MTASILGKPKFCEGQIVEFVGGEGIIKNYRFEPSSWLYLVEMPIATDPEMDRVGYETMIWLAEGDIFPLGNNFSHKVLSREQKNFARAC
ncbi:hypothetical protein BV372_05840 [Nostoc sp. T09]|uniref:hypothetical protein n=1 Tax=Nostoc sp. T09 TaxID=1932621 RepID=UPI000A3A8F12|nr:hypothetical protein [Nostoc sp. T09]OUL36802.1 hypothetical protein BV372_05840 [Nostoc sp. T09]